MAYDVVVVGGGPAGSVTAALFADQGRAVLLVDAARFPRPKPCAEYVSPGGVQALRRLGVLERLEHDRVGRWLDGMEILAPSGATHMVGYARPDGQTYAGLSVPRLRLDAELLKMARDRGVHVREGWRVEDLSSAHGTVCGVVGPHNERVAAELVVGADGLNSIVGRKTHARARARRWPRRLGLIAHFSGVSWPEPFGRMLVGRHGYVGVAPLDHDGRLAVGFVRNLPRGRLGSPRAALTAGLAEFPALAQRLRSGTLEGSVSGMGPLARRVVRTVGAGFALVGDAAGFFDPFTGEGIFRALRSAELLTSDPADYPRQRVRLFGAKARLVTLVQIVIQTPRLMEFAIRRLQERPKVARELGLVLGDLEPARFDLAWRLLGP